MSRLRRKSGEAPMDHPKHVGSRPPFIYVYQAIIIIAAASMLSFVSARSASAWEGTLEMPPAASSAAPTGRPIPPPLQGPPALSDWRLYTTLGGALYQSGAQTSGGIGGGLGVQRRLSRFGVLEAQLSALTLLGRVLEARVGVGILRPGLWSPAILVTGGMLLGDRLRFIGEHSPTLVTLPPLSLGLTVAPLRFSRGRVQASLLELGLGLGLEAAQPASHLHVTVLRVGVALPQAASPSG